MFVKTIDPGGVDVPGAASILAQREAGPARKRVWPGLEGRAPARERADILDLDGTISGKGTSGGFAPTVGPPIAIGYVMAEHAAIGTKLACSVRNKALPANVAEMPFVPLTYFRKSKI